MAALHRRVVKSVFQPQGPGFKIRLSRVLNIYIFDLLSAKVDSAFHPYEVDKMSTSFCWGLSVRQISVPSRGSQ